MQKRILVIVIILFSINQSFFCQAGGNNCSKNVTYFANNLPMDGANWFVPIKYSVNNDLIDLYILRKDKDELFIRFKIIENLKCDFKNAGNCNIKYKVLTYDEESRSYGERKSEIEFSFSNGKGKINIQHPNFPEIISDATVSDSNKQ